MMICTGHRICPGRHALAAQDAGQEPTALAGFFRDVRVAGAAFTSWHVGHDLLDMLATPGPGRFMASAAIGSAAHQITPQGGDGLQSPLGDRVLHIPLGVLQITASVPLRNPQGYRLDKMTTTGGTRHGTGC